MKAGCNRIPALRFRYFAWRQHPNTKIGYHFLWRILNVTDLMAFWIMFAACCRRLHGIGMRGTALLWRIALALFGATIIINVSMVVIDGSLYAAAAFVEGPEEIASLLSFFLDSDLTISRWLIFFVLAVVPAILLFRLNGKTALKAGSHMPNEFGMA